MNPYLDLYLTFARIGVCTFGGGYAMLPILQREVVENRRWATEDELMDYYAIGQCTPGVIAVNTSTFIGYKTHGILGGIAATAGMITPSLIIITIIAAFIQQFAHLAVVQHAFSGIRIAVCALVLQSVWKMAKKGVVDAPTAAILLITFIAVAFFRRFARCDGRYRRCCRYYHRYDPEEARMTFLLLFLEFFKTGLFAIGGGLATLPFLKQISLRYPWFTPNDLMDMIAVSESTPGPMGVNSATYAGFHAAGIPGALMATCSLVLPSVIIIILVSRALDKFRDSQLVKNGFYGLRPASAGLIFGAMLEVFVASLLHTENWAGIASIGSVINVPAIIIFSRAVARDLEAQKTASDRVYPDRRGMRHCV